MLSFLARPFRCQEAEDGCDQPEKRCCICLDNIPDTNAVGVHTTWCGHSFHSSCYITFLVKDGLRCPVCRAYPDPSDRRNEQEEEVEEVEEEEEEPVRISRKEAYAMAKKSKDPATKRSLATIAKRMADRQNARARLRVAQEKIDAAENEAKSRVDAWTYGQSSSYL